VADINDLARTMASASASVPTFASPSTPFSRGSEQGNAGRFHGVGERKRARDCPGPEGRPS
jgi:hypothetical protein